MHKVLASIVIRDEEFRLGAESLGKYGKKLGGYRDGLLRTSEPQPLPSGRRARLCLGTDPKICNKRLISLGHTPRMLRWLWSMLWLQATPAGHPRDSVASWSTFSPAR